MTSTDQIRIWYNQTVTNHSSRGLSGYKPTVNWSNSSAGPWAVMKRIPAPVLYGDVWVRPVHKLASEYFDAYIQVMWYHDVRMPSAGGVGNARNIGTGDWPSLHAYLCAIDLPPNSYKSAAFQADVLAIKTTDGRRVFRNLSGDRMHDQIDVPPGLSVDWSTVVGSDEEEDVAIMNKADWRRAQEALRLLKLYDGKIDGIPGDNTEQAVKDFQKSRKFNASGYKKSPQSYKDVALPDATLGSLMGAWEAMKAAAHTHALNLPSHTGEAIPDGG